MLREVEYSGPKFGGSFHKKLKRIWLRPFFAFSIIASLFRDRDVNIFANGLLLSKL